MRRKIELLDIASGVFSTAAEKPAEAPFDVNTGELPPEAARPSISISSITFVV